MPPGPFRALALASLLATTPALAEPGAPAPTYPIALAVRFEPAARRASLAHVHGFGEMAPRNPDATLALGDQALVAYALAANRMFRPAQGVQSDAVLVVRSVRGELRRDPAGWRAEVEHELVLLDSGTDAAELGRWTVSGQERVEGLGPGALPLAFGRAAKRAAVVLEATFGDPPGVARWLAARGAEATRPPPPAPEPLPFAAFLPEEPGPGRADRLRYVDLGLRFDRASGTSGASGRIGLSNRWGFVQAGLAYLDSTAPGTLPAHNGQLRSWELGLEAGLLARVREVVELRAGAGIGWLSAKVTSYDVDGSASRLFPVLTAGALYSTSVSASGRMRLGLRVRKSFDATLRFDWTPAPGLPPEAAVSDLAVELAAGLEYP